MTEMIDWTDSNKLFLFSHDNIKIAREYYKSRKKYAEAKKKLNIGLAKYYNANKINTKLAIEKAILMLVIEDEEFKQAFEDMTTEEQVYKGLEKVLEAQSTHIYLAKDLIKNKIQET